MYLDRSKGVGQVDFRHKVAWLDQVHGVLHCLVVELGSYCVVIERRSRRSTSIVYEAYAVGFALVVVPFRDGAQSRDDSRLSVHYAISVIFDFVLNLFFHKLSVLLVCGRLVIGHQSAVFDRVRVDDVKTVFNAL